MHCKQSALFYSLCRLRRISLLRLTTQPHEKCGMLITGENNGIKDVESRFQRLLFTGEMKTQKHFQWFKLLVKIVNAALAKDHESTWDYVEFNCPRDFCPSSLLPPSHHLVPEVQFSGKLMLADYRQYCFSWEKKLRITLYAFLLFATHAECGGVIFGAMASHLWPLT